MGRVNPRGTGGVPMVAAASSPCHERFRRGIRMDLTRFAFIAAALLLAAPLSAEVQPAVQPGGDIPPNFHPTYVPPIPPGGDIPRAFNAPRSDFQYVRREAMIPMRDGVKLYTVLIIPRGAGRFPIMLDRTPYSAKKS